MIDLKPKQKPRNLEKMKNKLEWFRVRDNRRRLIGWLNFFLALAVIVITKIGISGFDMSIFYEWATYIAASGFMIASMIILYDFSDKGEYDERQEDIVKDTEKELQTKLKPITDTEKLGLAIRKVNVTDQKALVDEERDRIVNKIAYKIATATARGKVKLVNRLKAKKEYYQTCSISVPFKPYRVKDIISNGGGIQTRRDEINFSPKKAIRKHGKYSIMIKPIISIFLTSSVVATFENVAEAVIYLVIVIPILLAQCLWVYEKARYYTANDYLISIRNKMTLIDKLIDIMKEDVVLAKFDTLYEDLPNNPFER